MLNKVSLKEEKNYNKMSEEDGDVDTENKGILRLIIEYILHFYDRRRGREL